MIIVSDRYGMFHIINFNFNKKILTFCDKLLTKDNKLNTISYMQDSLLCKNCSDEWNRYPEVTSIRNKRNSNITKSLRHKHFYQNNNAHLQLFIEKYASNVKNDSYFIKFIRKIYDKKR